jgi:hypothetical protein
VPESCVGGGFSTDIRAGVGRRRRRRGPAGLDATVVRAHGHVGSNAPRGTDDDVDGSDDGCSDDCCSDDHRSGADVGTHDYRHLDDGCSDNVDDGCPGIHHHVDHGPCH